MIKLPLLAFIAAMFFLPVSCSRPVSGQAGSELRFGVTTEPVTLDPLNPANTADGRSIL
jgi:ABC-type oligopeptide transport system substrate-binding subunit